MLILWKAQFYDWVWGKYGFIPCDDSHCCIQHPMLTYIMPCRIFSVYSDIGWILDMLWSCYKCGHNWWHLMWRFLMNIKILSCNTVKVWWYGIMYSLQIDSGPAHFNLLIMSCSFVCLLLCIREHDKGSNMKTLWFSHSGNGVKCQLIYVIAIFPSLDDFLSKPFCHVNWLNVSIFSNFLFDLQAITASGTKKSDLIFGEIQTQLKNKYVTVDVKANSDSSVSVS